MKITHLADIQADDKFMDELVKCGDFALEKIREENPDLIVVAGDVFHDRGIKLDSLACKYIFNLFYHMSEVAPVAVVTGTPSHEGHATENLKFASSFEHSIYVSTMPEQLVLINGQIHPYDASYGCSPDAIISMVPEFTKQYFQGTDQEMADAIKPLFYGFAAGAAEFNVPHILVGHFTVSGATLSNHQQMVGKSIEIGRDDIGQAKADLVCLGHIHKSQHIDMNIFYSGSLFRVDSGETEDKGFYMHEIHKAGTIGNASTNGETKLISKFITTPAKKILTIKDNFTGENGSLIDKYRKLYALDGSEVSGADVKVQYQVYQDEAENINKEDIINCYKSAGANSVDIKIIRIPRENVRSENLMKLTTLRDKIGEMARLKDETVSDGILDKADMLESMLADEVLAGVSGL